MDIARTFNSNGNSLNEMAIVVDLGTGGGMVEPSSRVDVTACFLPLAAGDFDRDGNLDLLASYDVCDPDGFFVPNAGGVLLFRGDGAGHLAPPVQIAAELVPGRIAVADFDGDGRLDFAVGSPGRILLFRGAGDGTFFPPQTIPTHGDPRALVAGDLNKDGWPDLVVGDLAAKGLGEPGISVFLNDGSGGFRLAAEAP